MSPELAKSSKSSELSKESKGAKSSKSSEPDEESKGSKGSKGSESAKGSESSESVKESKESKEAKEPWSKMKNPGFTRARAFAARYRSGLADSLVAGVYATGGHRLRTNHRVPSLPQQNRTQSPPGSRVLL